MSYSLQVVLSVVGSGVAGLGLRYLLNRGRQRP